MSHSSTCALLQAIAPDILLCPPSESTFSKTILAASGSLPKLNSTLEDPCDQLGTEEAQKLFHLVIMSSTSALSQRDELASKPVICPQSTHCINSKQHKNNFILYGFMSIHSATHSLSPRAHDHQLVEPVRGRRI